MKKIKILTIRFDNELYPYEIPKFRGAVVNKLSEANVLFHNHTGDTTYRYAYPLIQYKQIGGKAAIICINEGTESVHELFRMENRWVQLGEREMELNMLNLNANQFVIQVWEKSFRYTLSKWFPLNQDNYRIYARLTEESEKKEFLQRMLVGNILSFAKGIGLQLEKEVVVQIDSLSEPKMLRYKDARLQSFDISFSCNVFLPNYIGLGKGASHGFGTVKSNKSEN